MKTLLAITICASDEQPRPDLACAIAARIESYEARRARISVWTYSAIDIAALVAFGLAVAALVSQIIQSGSATYASLAVSNLHAFASYGRDALLAFAESLPVLAIIATFAALGILIWSLSKTVRAYRPNIKLA